MNLSSLSIRRPVLAIVMSVAILLFGALGYTFLGVREYPVADPPIITVTAEYTGANSEIIETQITEPLEESINGIEGIRSLTSVSREGRSTITVEFNVSSDLDDAANDVRARVSRAQRNLPPDAEPPVVTKSDADARPIVFLNIKSKTRNLMQLTEYARNVFKERLQTINGVSEVRIWGSKDYSMRLWMDPVKLAAYRVTPADVRNAVSRQNIELPAGRIEGENSELTVRAQGRLSAVEEFNNLIVKEEGGDLTRFRDIGYAEVFPQNERTLLKRDGVPMTGVVLIPQPGSNHIEIVDEFYRRVGKIEKNLPPDIELGIGFDQTKYIRESVSEVEQTIFIAFGLVILIIFLFLRDWRTTIIPVIVIPIALIGTFFILYLAGYSINVLTLLGLVLAIGLVVDDAIVVLENIYKKIENGMPPLQAGLKGIKEIFFAVISTTAALAAIFLPIMFLEGLTGRLFREFGVTLAGAVIISSFVALTLTPMLATRILKKRSKKSWFYEKTEPFFVKLGDKYARALNAFMKARWVSFIIIAFSLVVFYFIGRAMPSELAPLEDRSSLLIFSTGPEGASFDFMENYMNSLVGMLSDSLDSERTIISVTSPGFGASTSVNSGFIRLQLIGESEREKSQMQIAEEVSQMVNELSSAKTFVSQEQSISTSRFGLPVQYVLQAPNIESLKRAIPIFMSEARKEPAFQFTDVNLKFNKPELAVRIYRQKALEMGVSVKDIAEALQLTLSGQRIGFYIYNGKQYYIIGQVKKEDRDSPVDLKSIYVNNKFGEPVQIDNLAEISEEISPPQLFRYNRYVSATISAGLAPGKTIGDGIEAMDRIARKALDDTYSTALSGVSKDFEESSSSLVFSFILAVALVFLVLSAQFESFRDPMIIMLIVPLALAGAIFTLWYFNQTINIFSQIGQIMLIGLVTKNGILIVEFANQKKAGGMDITEAVKTAARLRFRPILMTSLSTILGTLPIAMALGAGAESRKSMGIAIIGGLVLASILSLFVIPAAYSYLSDRKPKLIDLLDEGEEGDEVSGAKELEGS